MFYSAPSYCVGNGGCDIGHRCVDTFVSPGDSENGRHYCAARTSTWTIVSIDFTVPFACAPPDLVSNGIASYSKLLLRLTNTLLSLTWSRYATWLRLNTIGLSPYTFLNTLLK
jgi:hypothetical protein